MHWRRSYWALLALLGLVLTACGTPGQAPEARGPETAKPTTDDTDAAAPGEPLKIGFISPLSGPLAGPGQDLVDGFELYLEQNGGEFAGRPVELTVEDTQSQPDAGTQVARRLVEQVKVDLVVGPLLGNVGLAVGDYMGTTDAPLFYPIPSSDTFLRARPENMFVNGGTAAQDAHPLGKWAAEQGYRKVLTICQDYAFGHELCGGFTNVFTDYGGEIVEQLWAPLGTADYGPFMAEISSKEFDAVYSAIVGADSVKFIQTWNEFGLKDQHPLIASLQPLDQSLVRAMGVNADGLVSSGHYAEGRDSPVTRQFVSDYEGAFDKIPSYYSASGHLAGQWIDETLQHLEGEMPDAVTFLQTASGLSFDDSAFGPVTVDEHGNVIWNVYVRKIVDRGDGSYWNVVEETFEQVPPTYYYDYDAYLEQPVYSRDYQGIDWPTDCSVVVRDCPLE